jgi:hypothetical protein
MSNQTIYYKLLQFVSLLLGSALLLACSPTFADSTATNSPTSSPAPNTAPPATSTIAAQQAMPTIGKNLVVLVAGPGSDPVLTEQLTLTLSELAAAGGLDFEVRTSFTPEDSTAEIKLLASGPPDPGLGALAQSSPDTQFLGVAIPDLMPGTNLTVISDQESSPDKVGFLAGYLAAVVTPEWRVGVISNDSGAGALQRQGFINGAVFFCGLCRQTFPPFNTYPMFGEAPANSSPSEWLAIADILISGAVQTVYIPPGVGDESLFEYLADAGINFIGTIPPPTGTEERWLASITTDPSLVIRNAWPEIMAGQGGMILTAPLSITDINFNLFSPGRQMLVEKMLSDFNAGFIDPGVVVPPDSP